MYLLGTGIKMKLAKFFEDALETKMNHKDILEALAQPGMITQHIEYEEILQSSNKIKRGALKNLFNALGKPGIIGPHSGYETDFLIAGVKPIGFLPYFDKDWPAETPHHRQQKEDTQRLSQATEHGWLKYRDVPVPSGQNGDYWINRFYCQPDRHGEMMELATAYEKYWAVAFSDTEAKLELPKDTGEYLGYSKNDLQRWAGKPPKHNPEHESYIRWCRAQGMLMGAPRKLEF